MKKSISINISGMLFNIEEDAYERLRLYLDEIKHYFAGYEASDEIVADIESRIAEIFYTKVSPSKQVITLADVEALIAQMGNIRDFAAIEDPYEEPKAKTTSNDYSYTTTEEEPQGSRRLYRDEKHKIIGGVAAGIAHYLRVDPMWIRLFLVGFVAFDIFLTLALSSSALVLAYVVLWIALPVRKDLAEDKKVKKMYRNPDDKVLAGVAGGLAAYFGVDVVLIRVLFVLLFVFGAFGLLIYIILWISMPMANTLTERMQMQGEPVTLSNIEHRVKKNLNVKENEEETLGVRILLFPFRLISSIFSVGAQGARSFAHFLGEAIRVVAGFVLSIGGFLALVAMLIATTVIMGVYPDTYARLFDMEAPLGLLRNTIPDYLIIAGLLVSAIPVLFVLLMGVALLARRWVLPSGASWALAGVWLIALISTAVMIPEVIVNYRTDDYYETSATFAADSSQPLVLQMERGNWKNLHNIDLTIKGSPDSIIRLEKRIWGHGANNEEAREHAQLASYPVIQKGNVLLFSDQLQLPDNKPYYGQHAKATLYIPYGQRFTMAYGMREILYNTLSPWGYRTADLRENTFVFNQQGELECLSCPTKRRTEARSDQAYSFSGTGRTLNFQDFDELQLGSHYQLTLIQGPEYRVEVSGPDEDLDEMKVEQKGGMLSFFKEGWSKRSWKRDDNSKADVKILISVPTLAGLYLSGASTADVKLEQEKPLQIKLDGASEMKADLELDELNIEMSGSSELTLNGNCKRMKAELSGASELVAQQFRAVIANMDLSGASDARIWVTERLEADLSGGSDLSYRGKPAASNIDKSSGADVHRLAD